MEPDRETFFRRLLDDPNFCSLMDAIHYSFWVDFTIEEMFRVGTVGELFALIASKQKQPISDGCITRAVFYRLRQVLVKSLGLQRSEITPQSPLAHLMPYRTRRTQWEKLSQEMRLFIPDLRYPIWLLLVVVIGFIGSSILLFAGPHFMKGTDGSMAWMITYPIFLAFWVAAVPALISPFKRVLPVQTVGELTNLIATYEHASFVNEQGGWNQRDALKTLRRLISEQTGIPIHQIKPETRFPEDLGC